MNLVERYLSLPCTWESSGSKENPIWSTWPGKPWTCLRYLREEQIIYMAKPKQSKQRLRENKLAFDTSGWRRD